MNKVVRVRRNINYAVGSKPARRKTEGTDPLTERKLCSGTFSVAIVGVSSRAVFLIIANVVRASDQAWKELPARRPLRESDHSLVQTQNMLSTIDRGRG